MAERAERERHYRRQAERAAAAEAVHTARSARQSRVRLTLFLAALALLLAGTLGRTAMSWPLVTAALAGFAGFAAAVVLHARVEAERRRAVARRECAEISLARLSRDWPRVPAVAAADERPADGAGAPPQGDDALAAARAADLDVDGAASLMSLVGALSGAAAQRLLRRWLVEPPPAAAVIHARQDAARALARAADFREDFAAERRLSAADAGEAGHPRERFLAWAVAPPSALSRPAVRWLARGWTAAILICIGGALVSGAGWTRLWAPLALAAMAASFVAARVLHAEFDAASLGPSAIGNFVALIQLAEAMPADAALLQTIRRTLSHPASASDALGSLARRVGWSELRRGAPILHVPLQALTLWDFHVLFALDDWRATRGAHAAGWLDALAELDALIALGTLAHDEPGWAFPLIDDRTPRVTGESLGHPLIDPRQRVPNTVEVGPPGTVLLVTGSNMAGKSTLLRAIGTNVMLANAGAPVCAAAMTLSRLTIATSLRTADSLAQGVSGYMAGLLRLKQVLDEVDRATGDGASSDAPGRDATPAVLYLLDEVLGGTNSEERQLAVREIARHLLASHAIGVLTTHDLALADDPSLKKAAVPVHFRETVEPGGDVVRMTFDYRLRPGLATSTNALALLRALGLSRPS